MCGAENCGDGANQHWQESSGGMEAEEMKELATIRPQKNAEREDRDRESVTPNIGVTPEEFYQIAFDACSRVASRCRPSGGSRYAPTTRAAIALGLQNTLREIEAQATDEARVLEGKWHGNDDA